MSANRIAVPDLVQKLAPIANKACSDGAITDVLDTSKDPKATVQQGALTAVFGASIGVSIHLINGPGDVDDDGMIGAAAADAQDTVNWRPQVAYAQGDAWLKYALGASATAKATRKIGTGGVEIAGDRSLRVLCYKRHAPADRIREAVVADLDALASPLNADNIVALAPREATALKIHGALSGSLTLKWADVFSVSLGKLAEIAGVASDTFKVEVDAGASVSFSLGIEDDFTLCISREESAARPFRVALRKAVGSDLRFGAKVGITVGFADPKAVEAVLSGLLGGALDIPVAALAAIDKAPTSAQLPAQYRPVVEALADRFGIDAADPYARVKAEIGKLGGRLREGIKTIAEAKVTAGIEYEYLRMRDRVSVLEATMSEAALRRLHGSILDFDFNALLANTASDVQLERFLHEETNARTQAWGFSLGIGKWLKATSRQERKHRFVSRRHRVGDQDHFTHAYVGSTSYKASINAWSSTYGAECKADQALAEPFAAITGQDFRCGLHLWWEERLKIPGAWPRIVDDAVLWGIIPESSRTSFEADLQVAVAGSASCIVRFDALLDDRTLRPALLAFRDTEPAEWGIDAARGLPWWRLPARASCAARVQTYAPWFAAYAGLRNPPTVPDLRRLIRQRLDDPSLARDDAETQQPWALIQVLQASGVPGTPFWSWWRDFRKASGDMLELIDGRGDWRRINDAFADTMRVLEQTYLIRVVASRLARHGQAVANAGLAPGASLTIKHGPGDGKLLVVGKAG